MNIGASTACLYPLETEKALYELASRGVKNVEIFINSVDELEGDIFRDMLSIKEKYGVQVRSFHPFSSPMETLFMFSDYQRRTDYLFDIYKRYFERLCELGADVFVLHGAILSSKVPDDRYLERYHRLFRLGREYGVKVAQENICYCKSCSLPFLKNMSQQLGDECAFVIDVKQARRSNTDVFDVLDTLGEKVVHLHLSDSNKDSDCVPIGKGNFDFIRLFRTLDRLNYDRSLIVELYRENYNSYDDLVYCVNALQKLWDDYRKM